MNQLIDLVPLALFALIFFLADIYYATATLMIAISAQVLAMHVMKKEVSTQLKVTLFASLVFGGMTLILKNEIFIQWKPTVVNWLLSAILFSSQIFSKKNLLKRLLESQFTLDDRIWRTLAIGWSLGFFMAGVLNLIVAYNFSMEFWVGYKFIGGFGLTALYLLLTTWYLAKKGVLTAQMTHTE
tara:strand:- start:116 stop:667 length:552 start_codon:yes stop_codon:yes gene_type:complete